MKITGAVKRLTAAALSFSILLAATGASGATLAEKFNMTKRGDFSLENISSLSPYAAALAAFIDKGYAQAATDIVLARTAAEGDETRLTWSFTSQAGLYGLKIDYLAKQGGAQPISRLLYIDGEPLYSDAETLTLPRFWREQGEVFTDGNGDERAPALTESREWRTAYFRDVYGIYDDPLLMYLEAGAHTLTLEYAEGDAELGDITLTGSEKPETYPAAAYDGAPIKLQAESADLRSNQAMRRVYEPETTTENFTFGRVTMNALGGYEGGWTKLGESATWFFDAPSTGAYKLTIRYMQNYSRRLTNYRRLTVNGGQARTIPLEWTGERWELAEIQVYLEEGRNEITLTSVGGDFAPIIASLDGVSRRLSALIRDIILVTTASPDVNFDYKLDKNIPGLIDGLRTAQTDLYAAAAAIKATGKVTPSSVNTLNALADDLGRFINKPADISKRLNDLMFSQEMISVSRNEMTEQPLILDWIAVSAPDAVLRNPKPTLWNKLRAAASNFLMSFTKNYDGIGSGGNLSVWVAQGREWGEALQDVIDTDFTPTTGITVNVNVVPADSVGIINGVSPLTLSIITGNPPDVALGSDILTPVELAIRDSALDLSAFPDFAEVAARFPSGVMRSFEYGGGTFALPETMNFKIMVYRKDIFEYLGLTPPDTWEELYSAVLPVIKQNKGRFFIQTKGTGSVDLGFLNFYMFLRQTGGDLYTEDGLDTALQGDAAYAAFERWIKAYTVYETETTMELYNHFRTGDLPLAIATSGDYKQILFGAPELYGKWGVASIPGTPDARGGINRANSVDATSGVIFKQSKNIDAAWAFLKWWTSAQTQSAYADKIESVLGSGSRWFSANLEAFAALPWDKADLPVILQAVNEAQNPKNVLGGYMSSRAVNNAWTRVIYSNQPTRDAFEDAAKEIKTELFRKQAEYGIGDEQ